MSLRSSAVVIRRSVVALVLSMFVGVTAIAQTTPAWAVESWTTPVDLSGTGQDAIFPQIVAAPNNTLTAIWHRSNGTKSVIQTRSSSDGGATWSSPTVDLSDDTEDAFDPEIVAAPNNSLTAIWRGYNGTKYVIQTRTSSDGGATWSSPTVNLSDGTQSANDRKIVAAPNNTLTAIWRWYNGSKFVIQTRSSSDGGATWSSPTVNLSDITEHTWGPQIVVAPNNTLTAIWYRSNGTKSVIQTRSSSDGGATWSNTAATAENLSDDTENAGDPQIVAAPNNTLTAIWTRSNGTKSVIQTRSSSDGGATWSSPTVDLSDDTQSASSPQIAAAPNNTLTAIWYRYNGTKHVIQTRTGSDAGATWSSPTVNLSDDTLSAYDPQIVAAPNNTLTAIWYRDNGSEDIIQTRTSTDAGATWSSVVDLSATGEDAGRPQIVAAPNNTLTAIWYRSNGSEDIIQSSSLAPSSSSSASASADADADADADVPGIFLTVAGPVGRSASEAPIYYGADRVAVTSTYLLTVTRVSNIAPTITTLAEGTIDTDGSFFSMTRLPALTPGVYNVQMVGTHVNGSTLQLTSQITIGGVGEFTSIGANIPVIK